MAHDGSEIARYVEYDVFETQMPSVTALSETLRRSRASRAQENPNRPQEGAIVPQRGTSTRRLLALGDRKLLSFSSSVGATTVR